MTAPTAVLTVVPNTATRTEADLTPPIVLTDTATHTPAATARTFKAAAATIKTTTGDAAAAKAYTFPCDLAAGVTAMGLNTVNADGNDDATTVNLTVTDGVAGQADVLTKYGISRQAPDQLPLAYRDPIAATPGVPTAVNLLRANLTGTIAAPA